MSSRAGVVLRASRRSRLSRVRGEQKNKEKKKTDGVLRMLVSPSAHDSVNSLLSMIRLVIELSENVLLPARYELTRVHDRAQPSAHHPTGVFQRH